MSDKTSVRLSVIGAVLFFAVVVGVTIARNDKMRKEIEDQVQRFLKSSKKVLNQYEYFAGRIGNISSELKSAKKTSTNEEATLLVGETYDSLWLPAQTEIDTHF